jgi:FAD/FMN-containing dehydrogenase
VTLADSLPGLDGMTGTLIGPDHEGYDLARRTFNGTIDHRPAAIVQCRTIDDIVAAVRAARSAGLHVAIRGGGHGVAGHAMADGALVVDLREMRSVTVDLERRTARAAGGALWEDVDRATTVHGLATPGGTFGDTGIGGLTLTGGIGFLMGTAGLSCDNLVRATVVTADGSIVEAGEAGDPELLWALRGGGGTFGVVTEFEFALHPLGPIYVADLALPLDRSREGLEAVAELARTAPPELVLLVLGPTTAERPLETAPRGPRDFLRFSAVYHGPLADADDAVRALRAVPQMSGAFEPITYPELQAISGVLPFGLRHYWKGHLVRDLDETAIDAVIEAVTHAPGAFSILLLEAITGVARTEPAGGAAFGQRQARWNITALGIWEDPVEDAEQIAWARRTADAIGPASLSGAGYGNYASADETAERVRASFGTERFERLARVKRRYDPDNTFRSNLNIPPAAP